jgi:hypothetical protein
VNELHYKYGNFLTSGVHLSLLFVGAKIGTLGGWVFSLAAIGLVSLIAWGANFRRSRAVADTPTSRVGSAPQGYVELFGRAQPHAGYPMTSPLSLRPCVWYRFLVEEKRGKDWQRVNGGMSSDTFVLNDGTGQALVDPDRAEIITTERRTWREGKQRYTEWLLTPGGQLYALGDFRTEGGSASMFETTRDLTALLAEWKANKPALLERFDLDGNGEIDLKEWELARKAARREVRKQHQEIRSAPGVHILRKPKDGRLFLIANLDPNRLARRYLVWTVVQLVIAIGAGAGLVVLLTEMAIR